MIFCIFLSVALGSRILKSMSVITRRRRKLISLRYRDHPTYNYNIQRLFISSINNRYFGLVNLHS